MSSAITCRPSLRLSVNQYPSGLRHAVHTHDEMHLSVVLAGSLAETVGGITEFGGALSVVVKAPEVAHADEFGPRGAILARLALPGAGLEALVDDARRAASWRWTHDGRVATPFLRLLSRLRRRAPRPVDVEGDDADLADLLAALTARPCAPSVGVPPRWLARTIDAIRAPGRNARTSAGVAHEAGVHPVYLARCIRRWYGTGLGEELRRARLRDAVNALNRAETTIAAVAHEHGYADEPHFNRDLRRATGLTPGRYRELIALAKASVAPR